MHRSSAGVAGRTGLAEDEAPGFDFADGICRNHDRSPSISVTITCALRLMVEKGSSLQDDMVKRIDSAVLSFGGTVDQLAVRQIIASPQQYPRPKRPLPGRAPVTVAVRVGRFSLRGTSIVVWPIRRRVAGHRNRLREAGLRTIRIWVPDSRRPGFAGECRRQSRLLQSDPAERRALEFIEKVGDLERYMKRGDIVTVATLGDYQDRP